MKLNLSPQILFIIVTCILFSGSFYTFISNNDLVNKIILVIYIIYFLFYFKYIKGIFKILFEQKLLILFFGVLSFSAILSSHKILAFENLIILLATTLISVIIVQRYSLENWLKILSVVYAILIIMSFVYSLTSPNGIETGFHAGAWKGIYLHKNQLGFVMVFSTIVWLSMLKRKFTYKRLIFFLFSLILVLLSDSSTGLIGIVISIIAINTIKIFNKKNYLNVALVFFGFSFIISVMSFAIINYQAVTNILGKDITLTGRTVLWGILLDFIKNSPFFGYGYGVFWLDGGYNFMSPYWSTLKFFPQHGHNGYLDLALDGGISSLIIMVLILLSGLIKSYKLVQKTNDYKFFYLFTFLVTFMIYNLSESVLLKFNNLSWIMFITVIIYANIEYKNFKQKSTILKNTERLDKNGNKLTLLFKG
ncbi:O-antigen ligase family protein [Bacillus alveayuensis]|uniref:O-antigen ligase family protein n=1 Tax=Aeribacillus alveayuensis TaxID=279215 RepID=UPI0005D10E46|nr:O-antigen ligase family protein [Bacillus alveayuensis]